MVGFARSTNILTNLLPFVETFSDKNKVIRTVFFFSPLNVVIHVAAVCY